MAHINLLPWREERRQERQQQFIVALVAGLIFAAVVLYSAIWFADSLIGEQNDRNSYMQREIAVLDKKIKEIEALERAKERLLARMQVIQDLQSSRPKVVKVFDSLTRVVPDGIHLNKLTRQGKSLTLNGMAESNARVSVFMQKLDKHIEFDESNLKVVQRTSNADNATRNFTLTINESEPKKEEGEI